MIPHPSITDHDRRNFMAKLSDATRARNGLLLTPWEMEFLHSWRSSSSPSSWFIGARREFTDRLRLKYGGQPEINMPHPDDLVTKSATLSVADADPTGCEYLVKGDNGRQTRCNEPAIFREPGRLRYCETHGEDVVKAMKRIGKTLRLIKFL